MSLLTELYGELLTESGLPLLAENETESGTVSGMGITKATLSLVARATLSSVKVFTPLPINAKATLRFIGTGLLHTTMTIKAKATLRLIARQGIAKPPSGLGMLMKIIYDPIRKEVVLDQYLLVWFNGHPNQCTVALQLDDEAEIPPAFIWQNPGLTQPAFLRIDSAEIPSDGQTHEIKVSVWQNFAGRTSTRSTLSQYAKTPTIRPATQPEWCGATGIREGEVIRSGTYIIGNITDLTRINWRHTGAVQIMARIPVLNNKTGKQSLSNTVIGYADHDETTFYAENIGLRIGWEGGILHHVLFGVAAIQNGTFGPVTWANAPVNIRDVHPQPSELETNPDVIAGTSRVLWSVVLNDEIGRQLFAEQGWPYSSYYWDGDAIERKRRDLLNSALSNLLRKIKDITRKGGRVTLDDFGCFEAHWNATNTLRSVLFVPSPGFIAGTKAGYVMTDAQAKAMP